ncbi:MAG: o-succinylbenzoate--CoA ligase [Anaerolineae bacterium]
MRLDWLAQQAAARPRGLALVYGDRRWTYAELNDFAAGLAGRLAAAGVRDRHHVAVLMPNRPAYVGLIHALARLGAVLVPLNLRLTPDELAWQLDQADCRYLICSRETAQEAAALDRGNWRTLSVDDAGGPPPRPPAQKPGPLDLSAMQAIVHTSGTTGRPKGAMLTYANHLWSATASAFRLGTDPADRWLLAMPLYHVGGLAIVLRCCLYGTAVVLQPRFEPEAANRALETQAISLVSLVPTMLQRLLEVRGPRPFPSTLRCILLGGGPAPEALLERCRALDAPLALTYGLTEAASQVATSTVDQTRRKPGGAGRPLLFSTVRIVGQDGEELPPGEVGQILVRGPTVMPGYYRQPQASAETLAGGELHTGDLGYLDDEGDLWPVQRRADLIVSGGENVYPAEVERVLLGHPAVEAACVVGLADEVWGQRVAAAVVLGEGAALSAEALLAFCRARLAGYKQPRLVRFVEALPQTASGKVQRGAVAELLGEG